MFVIKIHSERVANSMYYEPNVISVIFYIDTDRFVTLEIIGINELTSFCHFNANVLYFV